MYVLEDSPRDNQSRIQYCTVQKAFNMYLFIIVFLFSSVLLGSPIARETPNEAKLPDLRLKYPGIYWDTAAEECNEEQFNIIIETVRVASDEVVGRLYDGRKREQSASFNRFFIRAEEKPMTYGWTSSHDNMEAFLNQRDAMDNLIKHIRLGGRKNDKDLRLKKIKYKCKAWPTLPCGTGTAAKTSGPLADEDDPGWSTVFCPIFFSKTYRYINEIGNDGYKEVSELPQLHAREHVVVHELAHADVATGMRGATHIVDVKADLPGYRPGALINGANRAHRFAWVNAGGDKPAIQVGATLNADNYAWVFTNEWFKDRWGWNDDGRTLGPTSETDEDAGRLTQDEENIRSLSFEDLKPGLRPNCHFTSDTDLLNNVYCAWLRSNTGDEWLQAREEPFSSKGGCMLS